MPQKQCPWCGRLGLRCVAHELSEPWAQPHADGSSCVCRHITCGSRREARRAHGRYYDNGRRRWICFGGC